MATQLDHAIVTSSRATELLELAASEGIELPLSVELIIWLEDRGHIIDLHTGSATLPHVGKPTPSGKAVSHLLTPADEREHTTEYEDYLEDVDWLRHGC